jgi:hypothetical protein
MTTTYQKVKKVIEQDKFVRCICDGCGIELPDHYGNREYSRREFELKFESGSGYPDGGFGTGWRVNDLCDTCVERLRTALGELGFTVEIYKWDY